MFIAWLKLMRPAHWTKNLFVLAPLLFARQLFDFDLLLDSVVAFGLFCLLSSSVYLFNDVMDADNDRAHPIKFRRPIAAGTIKPVPALVVSTLFATCSILVAFLIDARFGMLGAGYLTLNLFYSRWLKKLAFVDVMVIAAGFVLRVVAGAVAIDVKFSVWLVLCTFCLAFLLALGKRRHELEIFRDSGVEARPALAGYTLKSLRIAEWTLAGITLASYILYTVAPGTVAKFGTYNLVFTLPFPVFGILRYMQLVVAKRSKVPTEALVTDIPSLFNLVGWVATVVIVLYDVF